MAATRNTTTAWAQDPDLTTYRAVGPGGVPLAVKRLGLGRWRPEVHWPGRDPENGPTWADRIAAQRWAERAAGQRGSPAAAAARAKEDQARATDGLRERREAR